MRTSSSYGVAHQAVDKLQDLRVWPTPLNYELCLHYIGDPDGSLARAVDKLISEGALHSDDWSERLAREFLPRLRLQDDLNEAGEVLTRELDRVTQVLDDATSSNVAFSQALTTADHGLNQARSLSDAKAHLSAAAVAIRAADARSAGYRAQLETSAAEVGQLRQQMERVRREAMTDPLTSLANRRAFEQDLTRACAESDADGTPLTLAMIDIDHFKRFNDTWGHQTGDQVIRFIAGLLKAASAPPRIAARYGGEEFAIILPRETLESALPSLDGLRAEIARRGLKKRTTGEDLGAMTVSIGVAERSRGETDASLIERADAALYLSKGAGRNKVTAANALAPRRSRKSSLSAP